MRSNMHPHPHSHCHLHSHSPRHSPRHNKRRYNYNYRWFEVIPDDGRPVEYFDTIQGITAIKPKKFLVRTSTVGYELGEENGLASWVPREISPGEVLSTGMVYMDHRKTCLATNMKNLFKRFLKYRSITTKKDQDLKYLQCFDGRGHEIMIPLIMTGVFSPIGDPNDKNYDAVYELKDLTTAFDLPVKAQLIHAESHQKHHVPHGVLKLESVTEDDCVVVTKDLDRKEQFELPLDEEVRYVKDLAPKSMPIRKLSMRSMILPTYSAKNLNESGYMPKPAGQKSKVDLPLRVPSKESKKTKAPNFIERLSTRKTKKERAAFKALQEEGIFSSRLSKVEMPFDAFYSYAEDFENNRKKGNVKAKEAVAENTEVKRPVSRQSSSTVGSSSPPLCSAESSEIDPFESQYAKVYKKNSLLQRDLPPVPSEVKDGSESGTIVDEDEKLSLSSNDTLYEHLPEAPNPPPKSPSTARQSSSNYSKENKMSLVENEEDGYMVPSHLQKKKEILRCRSANPVIMRQSRESDRPQQVSKVYSDPTYANCKGSIDNFQDGYHTNNTVNKAQMVETSASTSNLSRLSQKAASNNPCTRRNSSAADHCTSRSNFQKNNEPQKLQHHHLRPNYNLIGCPHYSAELHRKAQPVDPNLTVKRHNMRRLKSAMEVFHFSDSFREMRPTSYGSDCSPTEEFFLNEQHYDHNVCPQSYNSFNLFNNNYNSLNRNGYPESDPGNRYFVRSISVTGLNDHCVKHGDDSAISLCSKGDYGFQGNSDCSYSEYADVFKEDGWLPPDNINSLSVQDVSRSLRYIGMKDRVVKRFANEQIDGQMLASLDWKLLKDGFPELNTLEVKKIIDFVNGWRPKKSIS